MTAWDSDNISQLLEELRVFRGDSTRVEVKRAQRGLPENIAQTVCAFANMPDGGTIIFGADERRNFTVTGVNNPAELIAGLVSKVRETITPSPFINAYSVKVGSHQVVVAEVLPLPLTERPARLAGMAYLRLADGDYVMHEHELRMLEVEKNLTALPVSYDLEPVMGTTLDDLVPELIDAYVEQVRKVDRRLSDRDDAEILRRTSVVTADDKLTLAGLYAFGDYPQGLFPSLTVTAAVQLPQSSGARNKDLQDFTGPLPVLLEDAMNWCKANVSTVRRYRADGNMEEDYELPMRAIRELITNALVHRDLGPNTLGIGKAIQIRLTPSNLMVLSPGGLRGISLAQLESSSHAQAAVNQRLYSIAKKQRTSNGYPIIEGEGGGIAEVFRSAAEYQLPKPTLINTGVQFTALLWRLAEPKTEHATIQPTASVPRDDSPGSVNEPQILNALAEHGQLTLKELSRVTGLSEGQVRYALKTAITSRRVQMFGHQGKQGTTYHLA